MIRVKNMPVVDINDIEDELIARGVDYKYARDARQLMFDDRYINDVYMSYYIADDVYFSRGSDKEKVKAIQTIIDILREACPDSGRVLVDVSW